MRRSAFFLVLLVVISACSGKPYVVKPDSEPPNAIRSHPLSVVSHGWHTGLIIPASDLNPIIPELTERFGEPPYYEIGWGDKGFYQAPEISIGLGFQAMFWSEGAIMHVVAVPDRPSEYFQQSELIPICLTDAQIAALITFISASFQRDAHGHIVPLQKGLYGNSQFYDAEGRYDLLNTCNKWTAKGLQSAGVDIFPALSLTSGSVMRTIRPLEQQCTLTSHPPLKGISEDHHPLR